MTALTREIYFPAPQTATCPTFTDLAGKSWCLPVPAAADRFEQQDAARGVGEAGLAADHAPVAADRLAGDAGQFTAPRSSTGPAEYAFGHTLDGPNAQLARRWCGTAHLADDQVGGAGLGAVIRVVDVTGIWSRRPRGRVRGRGAADFVDDMLDNADPAKGDPREPGSPSGRSK